MTDFSKEFTERWTVEWNNIDIEGKEFFLKQGGRIESVPDADNPKWIKACTARYRRLQKDVVSKGYKAADIDDWIRFRRQPYVYWKGQEKAKKIPTSCMSITSFRLG